MLAFDPAAEEKNKEPYPLSLNLGGRPGCLPAAQEQAVVVMSPPPPTPTPGPGACLAGMASCCVVGPEGTSEERHRSTHRPREEEGELSAVRGPAGGERQKGVWSP